VTLSGVGTAEAKTGKLLSITLVGDGRFRNYRRMTTSRSTARSSSGGGRRSDDGG